MTHSLFFGLRMRLLLLVLLAIVPALGLILHSAAQHRQLAIANVQKDALRLTRLISTDQGRFMAETRQHLATLAYISGVVGDDRALCRAMNEDLLQHNRQYTNVGVADPEGNVICSAQRQEVPASLASLPFFQQALAQQDFASGNYQVNPASGQAEMTFGFPRYDSDGKLQAVVFATVGADLFNQIAQEMNLPEGATLVVLEGSGTILAHEPDPLRWVGELYPSPELVEAVRAQKEGTVEAVGLDDTPRLFAFTPLPSAGEEVFVSVGFPKDAVFAGPNELLKDNLTALGLVTILALAAAWLGGELFILRRVRALLKVTQSLIEGDWKARTGLGYGSGELSQLARVFDQMAEMLERREAERVQAEEEITRSNRNLAALNNVIAAVSASLEMEEIFESLKTQFCNQLGIPAGVIYTYHANSHQLTLEEVWGIPDVTLLAPRHIAAGTFPYDQVIKQKKAIATERRQANGGQTPGHPLTAWNGWRTCLAVPLIAKGEVQGILDLFSSETVGFTAEQTALITTIGQQVGVVIQNARLFEQIRGGRERLKNISKQVLDAQEAERRHISRELHDQVGQALTALKVNLQTVQRLSDSPALEESLQESMGVIDRTLQQVRSLSLDLRPSLLDDLGVVAAIRWHLDRQARRAGFEAQFTAEPPEMRLPPDLETTCFRVVQEAITNVVRHAQASVVQVEMRQVEDFLEVVIRDDGVGFDVRAARERGIHDPSLGLLGMEERVQLVGGFMVVRSDATQRLGTEIFVRLPLNPRAQPGPGQITRVSDRRRRRREEG